MELPVFRTGDLREVLDRLVYNIVFGFNVAPRILLVLGRYEPSGFEALGALECVDSCRTLVTHITIFISLILSVDTIALS